MAVPITIENVTKQFGTFVALKDVCVHIQPGELFFLLGPSGCGKTTLLRCVAGFYTPESGSVKIGERDITHVPPHQRNTGMVFQHYALWPHLTLAENIAFGLEMRKIPKSEIQHRVREALALVHLEDRAKAKPGQLSGGQQQRVAIARALVNDPKILLCDEPTGNLDRKTGFQIMDILCGLHRDGKTVIIVTHDPKIAEYADRTITLEDGRIAA